MANTFGLLVELIKSECLVLRKARKAISPDSSSDDDDDGARKMEF